MQKTDRVLFRIIAAIILFTALLFVAQGVVRLAQAFNNLNVDTRQQEVNDILAGQTTINP